VTLKRPSFCTKLCYEYKICENGSFEFERFLVLNSFGVACV
jgi:hypothetical protein